MKKTLFVLVILSLFAAVALPAASYAAPSFSDTKGHWAAKDIQTAIDRGYVSGYPDGTFKPNGAITRAEAAGMLSRITKLVPASASEAFADLEKHWAKDQVRKLVALGFIDPADYPKGFEPNKPITRFELMKWIASGLAKSEADFAQALKDTKDTLLPTPESFKGGITPEQVPYIALVRGTGIVVGFEDGTFRPATTTTRAEVVSTLLRYEKVEGTDAKSYTALNELREVGLTGTNMLSITKFRYFTGDNYTDFKGIQGKPISGRNKLESIAIHRMIFIPLEGSVYFDLYISPSMKSELLRTRGDIIAVIEEVSFTSNVDKLDTDRYIKEYAGGLVARYSLPLDFAKEKGFNTLVKKYIPGVDNKDYIKKGETVMVWFNSAVSKNTFHTITTDDNTKMSISDMD
ncbi:S-layer homology domain-containing protein [Cohnella caldifontis]|uniref:S-layer homology domain-containing protein n=1 Tax=Cohnella caldifontis TaxID=3027471 RepID=UPI0023EDC369|nr:S-layer homology domain-containing protein [Cohnella sp. YIM B05605]